MSDKQPHHAAMAALAEPILTDRLLLAPLTVAEVDEVGNFLMDEEIYSHIGGAPGSLQEAQARAMRWAEGSLSPAAIWINAVARLRVGQELVGLGQATADVAGDGSVSTCTLAYIVHPNFQGRGYAGELMSAFDLALSRSLRPKATHAHIARGHVASEAVARSLGLRLTTTIDEDGERLWVRGADRCATDG